VGLTYAPLIQTKKHPLAISEILLDKNENPFPLPPAFLEEIRESISNIQFNRYPDPSYKRLRNRASEHYRFPADQILAGNGGDEILWMLFSAFTKPGDRILSMTPTFSEYEHLAGVFDLQHYKIPLKYDEKIFSIDTVRFLKQLRNGSYSLILLDTPNNPSGISIDNEFLETIISLAECPVIVDEAYSEFADYNFLQHINNENISKNLVILKTLSKAWGLAGLRCGFGLCSKSITSRLSSIRSPFNVNIFTEQVAYMMLNYPDWMKSRVDSIRFIRDSFTKQINEMAGWNAYKSDANFVLLKYKNNKENLQKVLEENHIKVKYPEIGFYRENWMRVTIGQENEMKKLLKIFSEASV